MSRDLAKLAESREKAKKKAELGLSIARAKEHAFTRECARQRQKAAFLIGEAMLNHAASSPEFKTWLADHMSHLPLRQSQHEILAYQWSPISTSSKGRS